MAVRRVPSTYSEENSNTGTECSKCAKLKLYCASFEPSIVEGRCMRCNHLTLDHCLASGSCNHPFPIMLMDTSKKSNIITENQLSSIETSEFISEPVNWKEENTMLQKEVEKLRSDLKAAQILISELTTGAVQKEQNKSYRSFVRNVHLSDSQERKDELENINSGISTKSKYKVNTQLSLSERLATILDNENRLKEKEDTPSKTLMKNISRHTLITRKFINSHFEKLDTKEKSNFQPNLLLNILKDIQHEILISLGWIQDDCFLALQQKLKLEYKFKDDNDTSILFSYMKSTISKEKKVLDILDNLIEEEYNTIQELLQSDEFKVLVNTIKDAQEQAIIYSENFPHSQFLLEQLFEKYPSSALFLKDKEKENPGFSFSDSLLLPLRHSSNYAQFYSEILDCMNVSDESFTELVLLLSDSQKIENKISEIKSKFTSTSSAIRSQANLFNHKNGLLYNTSRELLGEHTVAIYKPELKELPFGKRFIIAKIYVFSDSLIIEFTSDISTNISKDLLNIDISTIVTVKENPSTFFNSNDISSSFQKALDNMFVVVTLTEKLLFCAKNSIEKNNILEDILSSFYVFCCSKDKASKKRISFNSISSGV